MREPLVIAVVQPLCVPYDVAVNAATHAAMVRAAAAGVVIFPELSLTGYELTAPAITAASPAPQVVRASGDPTASRSPRRGPETGAIARATLV